MAIIYILTLTKNIINPIKNGLNLNINNKPLYNPTYASINLPTKLINSLANLGNPENTLGNFNNPFKNPNPSTKLSFVGQFIASFSVLVVNQVHLFVSLPETFFQYGNESINNLSE